MRSTGYFFLEKKNSRRDNYFVFGVFAGDVVLFTLRTIGAVVEFINASTAVGMLQS